MEITSELLPSSEIVKSAECIDRLSLDESANLPERHAEKAHCLWCGRAFTARATGGSAQKFCSTEHRKAFWTAARRWTMRAIDAGLLSVDCLKAPQTSVHADGGAFRRERDAVL